MFNGKMKALTFSYDDGVTQDKRLIELFNKYGMKATFNLNSELLGRQNNLVRDGVEITHNKVESKDVRSIYEGHEVAAHTLTHPSLRTQTDEEIIRQVECDRIALSELVGYEVVGMAYPGGGINFDERVANCIRENTGVKYARTGNTTQSFEPYTDLYQYEGSIYHHIEWDKMLEMGEAFLTMKAETPQVFYIFGHSYEFDIWPERWAQFEAFLEMMSGRKDIFYGTNKEILL